jgi:hypothetical protein
MVNYSRPGVTGKMIEAHLARQWVLDRALVYGGRPYEQPFGGPSEAEIYSMLDTLEKYPLEKGDPDFERYAHSVRSLQGLIATFSDEAKKARADLLQWREEQRRAREPL